MDEIRELKITINAGYALDRIRARMPDSSIDNIVSAALEIYDMHQRAMEEQRERLERNGKITKNGTLR